MRASLPHYDSPDGGSAHRTWFASPIIDAEMVLKITPPVDPIDAGAVSANAFPQDFANRRVQAPGLLPGDRS